MKKIEKTTLIIAIILTSIILATGIAHNTNILTLSNYPQCGYHVLSLDDNIEFISNNPNLNWDSAYKVHIQQSQNAECLVGEFSASEINNKKETGDPLAQHGFWIELMPLEESCTYQFQADNKLLTELEYAGTEHWESFGWNYDNAMQIANNWFDNNQCNGPNKIRLGASAIPGQYNRIDAWCIKSVFKGTHGVLSDHNYKHEVEVTVDSNKLNTPSETKILGETQQSTLLGNNVYATWTGYQDISGIDCPDANDDHDAIYMGNNWQTISQSDWNKYWNNRNTAFNTCMSTTSVELWTENVIKNCVNQYNTQYVNPVKTPDPIDYYWGHSTTQTEEGGYYTGKVKLILERPIAVNELTLDIKADWLGIITTTGIPEITDNPQQLDLVDGETRWFDITVKNKGEYPGAFDVTADCTYPASSDITQRTSIAAGQTKTVSLDIRGGQGDYTCQICATSKTGEHQDCETMTGTITQKQGQCTPIGNKICSTNNLAIEQCQSDGYYHTTTTCQYGCIHDTQGTRCTDNPTCDLDGECEPSQGETKENCADCQVKPDWTLSGKWIDYIFIGIIIIFLALGLYQKYQEAKQ